MSRRAYTLLEPEQLSTAVVFASPHSGRAYLPEFLAASVLDAHVIRSSEDAFVDQLFDHAPRAGAPLLLAEVPRAYLDLNRNATELDPALIAGVPRHGHNPRIASGLGVVPRVVANGRPIYAGKLPRAEADRRIAQYWAPYHARLQGLMARARNQFGEAILVDCHSMPHEAVETLPGRCAPEVVIGDRFGASIAADLADAVQAAFEGAGLRVARNSPFAGAFVTQQYGRPQRDHHAIQIEIDRSLYMDEASIRPNAGFAPFRDLMARVIEDIADLGRRRKALAAE